MQFDWSSLFLFSSVVSSIIGAVYLFHHYQTISDKRSIHWLIVVMAANDLVFIEYIVRNSGMVGLVPHMLFIGTPAYFILLPALYIYQSCAMRQRIQAKLHFVLPALAVVLMVPTYRMSGQDKMAMFSETGNTDPVWLILIYLAFYGFYLGKIMRGIGRYRAEMSRELSTTEVEWDRISSDIIVLVSASSLAIPVAMVMQYVPLSEEVSNGIVKGAIVIFSLSGHFVLAAMLLRRNWEPLKTLEVTVEDTIVPSHQKEELDSIITTRKLYLDRELTLDSLAGHLGWSRTSLSQIINSGFNQNFYDYINGYRLHALEEKLRLGDHRKYSLDHLVKECGFSNYVTFYRFFKRKNGQSPSTFIKSLSDNRK